MFRLVIFKRIGLAAVILLMMVMWTYAFLLSPRESINRIGDRDWSARAEAVCTAARLEIFDLSDTRRIESPEDLKIRADLVGKATSVLQRMLKEVFAVQPSDEKGLAISAMWKRDYETYLKDRWEYVDILLQGENPPFAESSTEGLPISEKLGTFARANNMDSCAPPIDLSV